MKTLTSVILIATELTQLKKAISKYRNHPSVSLIKKKLKNIPSFSFN